MNVNHWTDNCPECGELLRQFHLNKALIPEDPVNDGWSGVEAYYCAGCDDLLIAVGFAHNDRDRFRVSRSASGSFEIPATPPVRSHACYIAQDIASAVIVCADDFQNLRRVRVEIGSRSCPDDPKITLSIPHTAASITSIRDTLHQWLVNTKSGSVTSQEDEPTCTLLHIEMNDRVRAEYMVERLLRRFGLASNAKVYRYNNGRRFSLR